MQGWIEAWERRMRASTCEEARGAVVAALSCEEVPLGRETTEAGAAASGPGRLINR